MTSQKRSSLLAMVRDIGPPDVTDAWFDQAIDRAVAQDDAAGLPASDLDPDGALSEATRDAAVADVSDDWFAAAVEHALRPADRDERDRPLLSIIEGGVGATSVWLDRRMAAAASSGATRPVADLPGDAAGLMARYEEDEEGRLQVRVQADELLQPLVMLQWTPVTQGETSATLVTPLASTDDGWAVRAQLGVVIDHDALELFAPTWLPLDALRPEHVEAAIGSDQTYGIAMRAWRSLLQQFSLPADLADLIDEHLRRRGR